MIPRTVQMAAEVAAQFTSTELNDYGNIILNGYATTGPNTTGKLAWQYKETTAAPLPLPSLTSYAPALKGWTTNYMEYYTQLPPNAYNVNPGDPTMFEYTVHSFTPFSGPIVSLGGIFYGEGYTPGVYTGVATTSSGAGTGATLDVTVAADGTISAWALNAPGIDYAVGDTVVPTGIGPGTNFIPAVASITVTAGGEPQWAQAPRRFYQNQVADFVPPTANQQAIQYSFMYPVADNPVAPPIDTL